MRIVGGRWRGRTLAGLGKGDPAHALRPTSDRVRESLFNTLAHGGFGDPVDGASVLDLFAGTGALGLEALSRGAARAVFVEKARAGQGLIADNIARLGAGAIARLIKGGATRPGPPPPEAPFTLVFLDPPYGKALGSAALGALLQAGWLADDALIVLEEECAVAAPPGFVQADHRQYGGTHITFLRRA